MNHYLRCPFSVLILLTGTLVSFSSALTGEEASSDLQCTVVKGTEVPDCTDDDSLSICGILRDKYKKDIDSLSVSKVTLKNVSLYWDDPGWVRGPDMEVNAQYYRIYFSTTTYEQDNSIRYVDEYAYYFPVVENGLSFMSNVYHGIQYHGGSFILIKGQCSSTCDYSGLPKTLVREKAQYLDKIENIIRRSDRW